MVSHAQHAPARQPNSKSSGGGRGAQGGSKRQGKATKPLPAPLTETILMQAMSELPDGTRRATETCYQCFQNNKFTPEDFISFLRSISNQSRTLVRIFADAKKDTLGKSAVAVHSGGAAGGMPMQPCEEA